MKQKIAIWICGLCGWMMTLVSCVGTAPTREVHVVDSLNQMAYASRYKDLDVSEKAARRAYETARLYRSGKAEACNNLGFCAFMRMDFERAEAFHRQVYHWTKSELELLIADVGLMKIYQRTALNKEFYDCRNSAIRRMKRIAEDDALFVDKRERRRLTYARSEFFIVSAVYYYYLQQRPEALECIRQVERMAKAGDELAADTNQWLYYHYIKGSAGLCEGETPDVRRLRFCSTTTSSGTACALGSASTLVWLINSIAFTRFASFSLIKVLYLANFTKSAVWNNARSSSRLSAFSVS